MPKRLIPPVLASLALLFSNGCKPVDIKPAALQLPISKAAAKRGRALLTAAADRQGIAAWRSFRSTSVELTDTWPNFLARLVAMPWGKNGQLLHLQVLNGRDTVRSRQLDGPARDRVWGIQNWATYTAQGSAAPVFKQDKDITFWLPTIAYFLELPFRIGEADVVAYAGSGKFGPRMYHKVYATWNKAQPQRNTDQYVVWINQATGNIELVEYTVRDFGATMKGRMYYRDFRTVQGVRLAFDMIVGGKPGTEEVGAHRMQIRKLRFSKTAPVKTLIPRPDLRRPKYDPPS